MPVRCHVKDEILNQLYEEKFSKEEIKKINSLSKLENGKHLGLTSKLNGDTSSSAQKQLGKVRDRVKEIKINMMKEMPQKYCVNSLVVPMISFAPLQFNYDHTDLAKCDNFILDHIGKKKGFSRNDARYSLYLSRKNLGHEIKSLVDADIEANIRELEVILNGRLMDAMVARGRVDAMRNKDIPKISVNFIRKAIYKLARLGIHVRDTDDGITNYLVRKLEIHKGGSSIGCDDFHAGSNHSMKDGMDELISLCLDGDLFEKANRIVKLFRSCPDAKTQDKKSNRGKICLWWNECIQERKMDMIGSYWYLEWIFNPYHTNFFLDKKAV